MLFRLPENILNQITTYLGLRELVALGGVNKRLKQIVYSDQGIVWQRNDLLFPAKDNSITDTFIQSLVDDIPRSYAVHKIRLVGLPLSWEGCFRVFDHFAHSVDHIHVSAPNATLADLVYHLSVFAGNLAMLQYENKIPITFREYTVCHEEHKLALTESNYLGTHSLAGLNRLLERITLDDPPFERLAQIDVSSTDASFDHEIIRQIYFLTGFLAGRRPGKRAHQPDEDDESQYSSKHRRTTDPLSHAPVITAHTSSFQQQQHASSGCT
ncbi:hypothetical protein K492DRAFT_172730 [Lichtheimia hyalospora FSU 10163]|nr:hypothetical protein K492DRAFT_172730 [Lichtheimia hyalospora FSU 10163]